MATNPNLGEDDVDKGVKKALIIGVSDYQDEGLEPLPFCKNDAGEMYKLLTSLGFEIPDHNMMAGEAKERKMKEAIADFFQDSSIKSQDTILFYFAGHGVPDNSGEVFMASSETDSKNPFIGGFPFQQLTRLMNGSYSTRIVTILDCCHSGAFELTTGSRGDPNDAAKKAHNDIEIKSNALRQGRGKCLIAASESTQRAYEIKEKNHGIFTYYLLEGLRGKPQSVDEYGNVTVDRLADYIYDTISSLPPEKKPNQMPIRKAEGGGRIFLAYHPDLAKRQPLDKRNPVFPGRILSGHIYQNDYVFESLHIYSAHNEIAEGKSTAKIAIIGAGIADKNHESIRALKITQNKISKDAQNATASLRDKDGTSEIATSLSALIASPLLNNNFMGVAPFSELVLYDCGLHNEELGWAAYPTDLTSGIVESIHEKPQVIFIAMGSSILDIISQDSSLRNTIKEAISSGITVIISSGYDANHPRTLAKLIPEYPKGLRDMITVSSIDHDDLKSDFSNYGKPVDICAYGTNIVSAITTKGKWQLLSGPIIAPCFVTGAVALMYTLNKHLAPRQVCKIIRRSGDGIDHKNEKYSGLLGGGKLNVYKILIETKKGMK